MIFNKTSNRIIINKSERAVSWKGLKGLMFEKPEKFDYGLIFDILKESRINASVHMVFVFFPICIVYLNENKRVVDKAILKPFLPNYTPKKSARYFIELPVSKNSMVFIGDYVEFD